MKTTPQYIMSIFALCLLAACSPNTATAHPAQTDIPTETITITPFPAPTTKISSNPTRKAAIQATAASTKTPTPDFPLLTPENWEAKREQDVAKVSGQIVNGQWQWWVEQQNTFNLVTHILNADDKTHWTVEVPAKYRMELETGDGYYRPVFKLPQEPYVYMTLTFCCNGEQVTSSGSQGEYGVNLARLNLETGEVVWPIPGTGSHLFFFSPRAHYLADIQPRRSEQLVQIGTQLRFMRFLDGQTIDIDLPENYSTHGNIIWSPDNEEALYVAWASELDDIPLQLALLRIDIQQGRYQTVVPNLMTALDLDYGADDPNLVINWASQDVAEITRKSGETIQDKWLVNLNNGEVSQ